MIYNAKEGILHGKKVQYNVFRRWNSLNVKCPAQTYVVEHLLPNYQSLWERLMNH